MAVGHLKVEGWSSVRDARFYKYQLRRIDGAARFVEIGSWKGRSSYCMAEEKRGSGKSVSSGAWIPGWQ